MYEHLLLSVGITAAYLLIFLIIFAESGLFFGFFFPGDSLLFALGLFASQGHFNIYLLILLGCIAAITGDSVGYAFGKRVGPKLFNRENARIFNKEHLEKSKEFYAKHGVKTIILARFVPLARTFAPILAGASDMPYPIFLLYNIVGGIAWIVSMTMIGYLFGNILPPNIVPTVEKITLLIMGAILLFSTLPALIGFITNASRKRRRG